MPSTLGLDANFRPDSQPVLSQPTRILFAEPSYFDVEYVINAHMVGKVGTVNRDLAGRQWEEVVAAYKALGFVTEILPAVPGLPDLCFVANQSFPIRPAAGQPDAAILSNMANPQRRPEVAVLQRYYEKKGWKVLPIDNTDVHFEGMGDAVWHPGRRVIYGGFGFRTHRTAYTQRSHLVDAPVIALELHDTRFYHLDTCLACLDEHTALWVPDAFTDNAKSMLQSCFERLIECPIDEASEVLACNGHCPDQKHFIVDREATKTMQLVKEAGFEPIPVDTGEFRKSGGSVQCLKLVLN